MCLKSIGLLCLASLSLAVGAAEVAVKAGNVALKPDEGQCVVVTCSNPEKAEFSGVLGVAVFHDLADSIQLDRRELKLGPGESRTFKYPWIPGKEHWGCAAVAELDGKKASYAFTVTSNLPQASPAMGTSHSTGGMKPEAVAARVQEFADCGVPIVEAFSWSPNLWGGDVCPETDTWRAGQGDNIETAQALHALVDKSHELGMLVYSYAQPCFRGEAGKRWCEARPEDVLYRTPDHRLDLKAKPFAAYSNPFNETALNVGLDSYGKALAKFRFDGVRWDGHPGVFYDPLGDWVSHCNGGASSFPYDSTGKPIILAEPDLSNAKLVEHACQRLGKAVPGLLWGFNVCMGPPEIGGLNITFPAMFRKLATDKLILQERHFHSGKDGRPYMFMNQRWSAIADDLEYSSELAHVLGAQLYRGDYGLGQCEPFQRHAFALHYASRSRTFAVCPWYRSIPNGGKYPYDFVRFALRYGKLLFHPSLNRFNPQKPLQRVSVTSQTPFPVLYDKFCYDLFADRKFRTVIHLLNAPATDQVNTLSTVEPPWLARKTVVSVRHPLGLDKVSAKYYVLSPEWPESVVEVKPDNTKAVTNVEVPDFRYWAMVVCEYEIGVGKQDYSSEGELFLPVLHRKGEL